MFDIQGSVILVTVLNLLGGLDILGLFIEIMIHIDQTHSCIISNRLNFIKNQFENIHHQILNLNQVLNCFVGHVNYIFTGGYSAEWSMIHR